MSDDDDHPEPMLAGTWADVPADADQDGGCFPLVCITVAVIVVLFGLAGYWRLRGIIW